MVYNKNNATAAAGLAAVALVVACMVAGVAAADEEPGLPNETASVCDATGPLKEMCMNVNITQAKEVIKEAFNSAVAEIKTAIKNTTFYKHMEADYLTREALGVCERVLNDSIEEVLISLDKIMDFRAGQVDHALDQVRIWLSGAITYKDTCWDAFAKTRGKSGPIVRDMLKESGDLLSKALALVIDFQKAFQSVSKDLEGFVNRIKSRQLLIDADSSDDQFPDFLTDLARKLIENPKITLPHNVVVAQDGSGDFKTIAEAVKSVPHKNKTPYVIFVKAGVYKEYVVIPKGVEEVVMVGEGPGKTVISGDKCFKKGVLTFDSATLTVEGRGFIVKDLTIENTAGAIGEQAVAVRATGDMGIYYKVHFEGHQDTLYTHIHRQLYRECRISGTIDFIFGNAIAVFQKCQLAVRKPLEAQDCMVTAQGRDEVNVTGITIIQGCNITADQDFLDMKPPSEAYLGRPWKHLSRTIIMQTTIGGFIHPEGWAPWKGDFGLDTLFYVEYNNHGPGADISKRVAWPGLKKNLDTIKTDADALPWTSVNHFKDIQWILDSGVPYDKEFL